MWSILVNPITRPTRKFENKQFTPRTSYTVHSTIPPDFGTRELNPMTCLGIPSRNPTVEFFFWSSLSYRKSEMPILRGFPEKVHVIKNYENTSKTTNTSTTYKKYIRDRVKSDLDICNISYLLFEVYCRRSKSRVIIPTCIYQHPKRIGKKGRRYSWWLYSSAKSN